MYEPLLTCAPRPLPPLLDAVYPSPSSGSIAVPGRWWRHSCTEAGLAPHDRGEDARGAPSHRVIPESAPAGACRRCGPRLPTGPPGLAAPLPHRSACGPPSVPSARPARRSAAAAHAFGDSHFLNVVQSLALVLRIFGEPIDRDHQTRALD